MVYKTEQEEFWAGEFGEQYIERNREKELLAAKTAFFSQVLSKTNNIKTVIEFGANIGLNLRALSSLIPEINLSAVEINSKAAEELGKIGVKNIFNQSILEFDSDKSYDLTFTAGVLIHVNPSELQTVYEKLYQYSKRYILIAEYYNPTPVEIVYHGNAGKLFKRDFAGEIMDKYSNLELIDYGFVYHRDYNFPLDDINWFLMKK